MPRDASIARALSEGAATVPDVLSKFKHVPGSPKNLAVWQLDEAEQGGQITDHPIQRKLVWTHQQRISFGDSLARGCPIPGAIILITSNPRDTDMLHGQRIDGKQRCKSITELRNGGNGVYYQGLDAGARRKFDRGELTVWKLLYTGPTAEKAHWVAQLFRVVNTIGVRLTFGELIHAEIEPQSAQFSAIIQHRLWRADEPLTKLQLGRMEQYLCIVECIRAGTGAQYASQTKKDVNTTIMKIQTRTITASAPGVAQVKDLYDTMAATLDRHAEARKHLGVVDFPALIYFLRDLDDREEFLRADNSTIRDMVLAIDKRWRVGRECACESEAGCSHRDQWGIRQAIGTDVRTGKSEYFARYVHGLRTWFDAHS